MRSLALYIEKWYIIAAVSNDGKMVSVTLPNKEDRLWLYFYEDIANNKIDYSKQYQEHYRNGEDHYYGDIFSLLLKSGVTFRLYGHYDEIRNIFSAAHIFDDLRKSVGAQDKEDIVTYVTFSADINILAKKIFLDILKEEHFDVKVFMARLEDLTLNCSHVLGLSLRSEGHYVVLNACNENLHIFVYQRRNTSIWHIQDDVLPGYGSDMRTKAMVEHVVDVINRTEGLLKTNEEIEAERLRMTPWAEQWVKQLNSARGTTPIILSGITLSHDSHRTYTVPILREDIDQRTEKIVKDIVNAIVNILTPQLKDSTLQGMVLIGDTFANTMFRNNISQQYGLTDRDIVIFWESLLPLIVNTYTHIDCRQFKLSAEKFFEDAEAEQQRRKEVEAHEQEQRLAQQADEERQRVEREKIDAERRFKDAMDKAEQYDRQHNYAEAIEYYNIALTLRPDSEEAKRGHDEALRQEAQQKVQDDNYKKVFRQAKDALDHELWDEARQKADSALSYRPDSREAQRIKDTATQKLTHIKEYQRFIDRADIFIANKNYDAARQELDKAHLLNLGTKEEQEIANRRSVIDELVAALHKQIHGLIYRLSQAERRLDYDEAIDLCNKLIEVDTANAHKWNARLLDIQRKIEQQRVNDEKLKQLKKDINKKIFEDKWRDVIDLCNRYLAIQHDDDIQDKLDRAQRKVKEQRQRPTPHNDDDDFFGSSTPSTPKSKPKRTISRDDFDF